MIGKGLKYLKGDQEKKLKRIYSVIGWAKKISSSNFHPILPTKIKHPNIKQLFMLEITSYSRSSHRQRLIATYKNSAKRKYQAEI